VIEHKVCARAQNVCARAQKQTFDPLVHHMPRSSSPKHQWLSARLWLRTVTIILHRAISPWQNSVTNSQKGAVLIKLVEPEIDLELRYFFSHYSSKAYSIWHICSFKACSNSRLVRFWLCQNLTNQELEHELDLRFKKFYKQGPWCSVTSILMWQQIKI